MSSSANPKNKLKRGRSAFKSASRARSEECIWAIEEKTETTRFNEVPSNHKKKTPLAGREFVRIITRDGVRDLLVPSTMPNTYTVIWPEREISRIQTKSKVLTVEDKMQEIQKRVEENQKLKDESEQRKQKLREIDIAKVGAKIEDHKDAFTAVDDSDNVKLLDRAFLAKQEQVTNP